MDSDDVRRFEEAVHVFADSVVMFNDTMAMTATNADSVSQGRGAVYSESDILGLTEKYRLGTNDLIKRLNT